MQEGTRTKLLAAAVLLAACLACGAVKDQGLELFPAEAADDKEHE